MIIYYLTLWSSGRKPNCDSLSSKTLLILRFDCLSVKILARLSSKNSKATVYLPQIFFSLLLILSRNLHRRFISHQYIVLYFCFSKTLILVSATSVIDLYRKMGVLRHATFSLLIILYIGKLACLYSSCFYSSYVCKGV